MIFKALKEKSNQKYVNKLLAERSANVSVDKISTIAVLLNVDEFSDFESFRTFFKNLNLRSPKHKIVAFTSDDKFVPSNWETYYSPKDFGWKDKIKNGDLQTFLDESFDLLISYYNQDHLYLNYITAAANANFKVGLSRTDERLYDLIIEVNHKELDIFKSELEKYLNILNKL